MKFEPVLDKIVLMDTVRRAYGYPISELNFVPEGEVGCHYLAGCENDRRYFLTVLLDSRLAQLNASRLDFTLALQRTLYDRGLFRSLAVPHFTRSGVLHAEFQGQPLIVYEYIPGRSLQNAWPYSSEVLVNLGRLTAQLHRSTSGLGMEVPFVEKFTVPFETDLRQALTDLDRVNADSRPGQQTLRNMLLPRREDVLGLLARLHELGAAARLLHAPLVLVHSDITPANILRTPQGELFIVDWEGAMLAPAEHDLVLFAGEGFSTLLAKYVRATGNPRLHPELFAYYFYRRNLEDMTDFLVRILHEDTTDAEDRHNLDLLESDCLSGLSFLEKSIEWAREEIRVISPERSDEQR
jgi:serine/threonine protein kinase